MWSEQELIEGNKQQTNEVFLSTLNRYDKRIGFKASVINVSPKILSQHPFQMKLNEVIL